MYILQECLFSFEELLNIQPKERWPIFFSSLDLRPYAKELRSRSPRGAEGYCSAALRAYEKKQPKRKSEQTGNANWGAKLDSFGNKITWFGYKIHLAVDTKSELPIALEVTPAHVNDGEMAPGLIEKTASRTSTRFFILDAGYDQMKVYEAARNVKAQAIIPLNLRGGEGTACWHDLERNTVLFHGLCDDILGS